MNQYTPIEERFWSKVYMEPMSGCWLWTGTAAEQRYGRLQPSFAYNGKAVSAYRWSYEYLVGPIPPGLMVCHKCDLALCVNPAHLFVGTAKDNHMDSFRKGRTVHQKYPHHNAEQVKTARLVWKARLIAADDGSALELDAEVRQALSRSLAAAEARAQVPRKPTEAMIEATIGIDLMHTGWRAGVAIIWRQMYDAALAPEPEE